MSNPLDSQKTKLLKTKTVDFSINNKQFSSNYLKKKAKITILFLLKNPKNNNIILVISISPIQRIGHYVLKSGLGPMVYAFTKIVPLDCQIKRIKSNKCVKNHTSLWPSLMHSTALCVKNHQSKLLRKMLGLHKYAF